MSKCAVQPYDLPMAKFVFAAMAAFMLTGCSSLLYYPTHVKYVNERKLPIPPKEVHFSSAHNKDLVAWFFQSPIKPAKGAIIFFHGNGQNLSAHFSTLYWIVKKGYDLFIFDYPGYGITPGQSTPKNTVEAGLAAVKWVHEKLPRTPLAVYAQSLGGAVGMRTLEELNGQPPICLLVLESTFDSYHAVARDALASTVWTWIFQPFAYVLISDSWSPKDEMSRLTMPKIVMHSKQDPVIRYQRGRDVFNDLPEPKVFWEVKGVEHAGGFYGPDAGYFQAKLLKRLAKDCPRP